MAYFNGFPLYMNWYAEFMKLVQNEPSCFKI